MRTTLTLDDDIADKLKQLAREENRSFKDVVNHVLKRGLTSPENRKPGSHFEVKAHRGGFRPGIDPGRLNQLNDQLELEDFQSEARNS